MKFLVRLSTILGSLVAAATCLAAPQQYATTRQNIRAGVVVLDTAHTSGGAYGLSAAPFALYNLDNATGVKPAGWNIYNPAAPGIVTSAMVAKWGGGLVQGTPIAKNDAEYWAVYLSQATDTTLSNYDFLLLNPADNASLSSAESAKLLKFVDQGGVLWIDPAGAATSIAPDDNFPLAFLLTGASGAYFANTFDPLLNTPKLITPSDLNNLITQSSSNYSITADTASLLGLGLQYQIDQYQMITGAGSLGQIDVARVGAGAIVVTATGISQTLNGSAGTGFQAGTSPLSVYQVSAAKLAVNMISLLGNSPQGATNSRKQSGGIIDVTAPVVNDWTAEGIAQTTPPVLYKGVYVSVANGQITVYKAQLGQSLFGNSNPDDGLPDYSLGLPYDIIWQSQPLTNTPLSAPVCATVPDATGEPVDQVLVVDGVGTLYAYNLFPVTGAGQFPNTGLQSPAYSVVQPAGTGSLALDSNNPTPNAPTVSGDLAYIADGVSYGLAPLGRAWIVDLSQGDALSSSGGTSWFVGGSSGTTQLAGYTASPTIAYVPIQDNSGGYDKVLYAPGIYSPSLNPSAESPGFDSLWLGVKGESPFSVVASGGTAMITTRAASDGGLPIYFPSTLPPSPAERNLLPKLTLLDQYGDALSSAALGIVNVTNFTTTGGGTLEFTYGCNDATYNSYVYGVRVDYTIDWGSAANSAQIRRGFMEFAVPTSGIGSVPDPNFRVLGSIAATSAGTLVMTVGNPIPTATSTNGSMYWVRENGGRGVFNMVGRFALYSNFTLPLNEGAIINYPSVFSNVDPDVTNSSSPFASSLTNALGNFRWSSPPSVRGTEVYATATATTPYGSGSVPATVVMAFSAEPSLPKINLAALNLSVGFSLTQPDIDRSAYGAASTFSTMPLGTQGTNTFDPNSGIVTLATLATATSGQVSDSLSESEPIVIRSTSPDQLYEPDAESGNAWSPLQWYSVVLGMNAEGNSAAYRPSPAAPMVTGNTLFFTGSSLTKLALGDTTDYQATVNAMNANIASNDPSMVSNSAQRSWQLQVPQETSWNGSGVVGNSDILMPQLSSTSTTSAAGYLVRLQETVQGTSTSGFGLVGGGNALACWGSNGIYGLTPGDFLVCDQGRVVQVDGAGNALFAANNTINAGPGGGNPVGTVVPLVHPTRAYPLNQGDMLVVDSGGNRVIKLDQSGLEERSIKKFFTDPGFKPEGYQANEPLNLRAPHDAITYSNYVLSSSGANKFSNPYPLEYWTHYLIADSGNKRLVEVVDRYQANSTTYAVGPLVEVTMADPNNPNIGAGANQSMVSVPQSGVLLWQSPSTMSGKNFDYNSVSRVSLGTGANERYVYVAGIGSDSPSLTSLGLETPTSMDPSESSTGNGGVVIYDPNAPNGIEVFNQFDRPDESTTDFFDPSNNSFDKTGPVAYSNHVLSNVTAVTAKNINGKLAVMVSMADGVYEFLLNDPPAVGSDLGQPDWFINNAAYTAIQPYSTSGSYLTSGNAAQFRPAYAKRLGSGDVLVVNGYTGTTASYLSGTTRPLGGSPYSGEVLVLNGTGTGATGPQNLGFNLYSIHFQLPSITGVRNLQAPVFADRR
jgi:hypothetical protein